MMKRIETWIWLVIVLALLWANQAFGQVQTAGTYDPKTGTVAVDTAKEVKVTARFEKAPMTVTGKLDAVKMQKLTLPDSLIYRFWYQTTKPVLGEDGRETGLFKMARIEGTAVELYSDRFVITKLNGQKEEVKTKVYRMYAIRRPE